MPQHIIPCHDHRSHEMKTEPVCLHPTPSPLDKFTQPRRMKRRYRHFRRWHRKNPIDARPVKPTPGTSRAPSIAPTQPSRKTSFNSTASTMPFVAATTPVGWFDTTTHTNGPVDGGHHSGGHGFFSGHHGGGHSSIGHSGGHGFFGGHGGHGGGFSGGHHSSFSSAGHHGGGFSGRQCHC